jgi:cytochrome c553
MRGDGSPLKALMMKLISSKTTRATLLAFAVGLYAGHVKAAGIDNCTGFCHGAAAQGIAQAPRLAGQKSRYILRQLRAFHEHTRDNPLSRQYMWYATENLRDDTAQTLALQLAALPATPARDGRPELVGAGQMLFDGGSPEQEIVACIVCHGPQGQGVRDIPRLGGLSYEYLKRRLQQWAEGYHATALHPMPRVAKRLSADDIEALASYLSYVQ